MTQYFYSDPLAAVWMAKHFGMKYNYSRNDGKSNGAGSFPDIRKRVLYPSPFVNRDGLATCKTDRGGQLIGSTNLFGYMNLYIHPDSLPLLEPRVGDWVSVFSGKVSIGSWPDEVTSRHCPNDETYPYAGDGRLVVGLEGCHLDWKYFDDCKIIQRDGVAFHWPEREEV